MDEQTVNDEVGRKTDTIPRARISEIMAVVAFLGSDSSPRSFEDVRAMLAKSFGGRAPSTSTAKLTVARDVLSDLKKLGYARIGQIPRNRSELERRKDSPCELTDPGNQLAVKAATAVGSAYDELLLAWINNHSYFREFTVRLSREPQYVPQFSSVRQLPSSGTLNRDVEILAQQVFCACREQLRKVNFPDDTLSTLEQNIHSELTRRDAEIELFDLRTEELTEVIQDKVVLPAFVRAEGYGFGRVTFERCITVAKEFLSAAALSSNPKFTGKTVFATCEFQPDMASSPVGPIVSVKHHGKSYADGFFSDSLIKNYRQLAGSHSKYVNIYKLRALVCVELGIQPQVFQVCLEPIVRAREIKGLTVFTELPFDPPPKGESYVEIGHYRVGRLSLASQNPEEGG